MAVFHRGYGGSGISLNVSIKGVEHLIRALHLLHDNLSETFAHSPRSALGRAVQYAALVAQKQAMINTPVDTGMLRMAHRIRLDGSRASIFIDPSVSNPYRGNKRPAVYGAELHSQGMMPGRRTGIRAFYQYTVEVEGPAILRQAGANLRKGLPI